MPIRKLTGIPKMNVICNQPQELLAITYYLLLIIWHNVV